MQSAARPFSYPKIPPEDWPTQTYFSTPRSSFTIVGNMRRSIPSQFHCPAHPSSAHLMRRHKVVDRLALHVEQATGCDGEGLLDVALLQLGPGVPADGGRPVLVGVAGPVVLVIRDPEPDGAPARLPFGLDVGGAEVLLVEHEVVWEDDRPEV